MFRDRMALAALVSGGDYIQAVRRRRELVAEFDAAMADLDLAITAAAPGEAPAIDAVGKFATFERPMLTMPFNVTGTPAMSVCCGYSAAGLPLALQLAGKPFEEAAVLRAAHAYEKATPWRSVRPRLESQTVR
jgi:aspartyl-tRNA(Asn)/glutamyl-tRNA(Gln) amidotransferase subunit A